MGEGAGEPVHGLEEAQFGFGLDAAGARLQALDGVVGDKGEKLVAALEKHNASFAARANVFEMALDEKSGHFNDIVSQRTREMIETLGQRSKQITEVIGNRSREMSDALEGHSQILADALDALVQHPDLLLHIATIACARLNTTSALLVELQNQTTDQPREQALMRRILGALTAMPRGTRGNWVDHE